MEAEGAWFLTKAACENLMDAQINTQRRQVVIQSLQCYNYSSFFLLDKHKGGFFFFFFISLPASYPFLLPLLSLQIGDLALIAPNTLPRHNKCLSAWCNCVCRSWRAMEERGLGGGELKGVLAECAWWCDGAPWWTECGISGWFKMSVIQKQCEKKLEMSALFLNAFDMYNVLFEYFYW